MYYRVYTLVGIVLAVSLGADSLYCFKCLNIDCDADDIDCQKIRALITAQLKGSYYFKDYMDPCPDLNETYQWRLMQAMDSACPYEKQGEATCTLGHMQIKSTTTTPDGKSTTTINHATVMGCATRQLLHRISNAYRETHKCDLVATNSSDVGIVRELQIEHCRDRECYQKDYCIDWKKSEIKKWPDQTNKDKHFDLTLKIGIFALVVVLIFALLIAGMFTEPASRPANNFLPKTIGDESEAVKPLQYNAKNSLTSIEDHIGSSINGSGTMTRPKQPPPPPPRLHKKPLTRESTPV